MDAAQAQTILNKIIGQITGYQNPFNLEQFLQKYAFDVELPVQVNDSTTGEATWSQSVNAGKFMTLKNVIAKAKQDDWAVAKRPLNSVEEILAVWNEINFVSTERQIDSINMAESDIYIFLKTYFARKTSLAPSTSCFATVYNPANIWPPANVPTIPPIVRD